MARANRTVRASEIGTFIFCQRAWWYQREGVESGNSAELSAGSQFHEQQASLARSALAVNILAVIFLITFLLWLGWLLFFSAH